MLEIDLDRLAAGRAASEVNPHRNVVAILPSLQIAPDPVGVALGLSLELNGKLPCCFGRAEAQKNARAKRKERERSRAESF